MKTKLKAEAEGLKGRRSRNFCLIKTKNFSRSFVEKEKRQGAKTPLVTVLDEAIYKRAIGSSMRVRVFLRQLIEGAGFSQAAH